MAVLACLLLLPAAITAVVLYFVRTWWAALLLLVGIIPAAWAAVLVHRVLTDPSADLDGSALAPFVIAALELIALWGAWHFHDPKSAGQALAIAEGAIAANHIKNDRPVLGAVTSFGAVSQWQHSTSLPPNRPNPLNPPQRLMKPLAR